MASGRRLELSKIKAELEKLQAIPGRVGPSRAEIKVTDRIVELNHREDIMWQKRLRVQLLAAGDKNTKYFHMRASQRKNKNKVTKLRKPNGLITENEHEMQQMATDFYKNMYSSEGTKNMAAVMDTVPVKVMPVMNDMLLAPFKEGEVK
jgi:hypothetical protein